MSTDTLPSEAEEFLRQLRLGLVTLPQEEREDIVAEVRSHLRDRHASGKEPLLEGFEGAQTFASQFLSEAALRGALARGTTFGLGKALLVGAKTGTSVLLMVVPLMALQLIGAALVVVGALKPFMPSRVGLFVDMQGRFVALGAYGGEVQGLRELLGFWAVPLFVVGGIGLLWVGNRALRLLAARRLTSMRTRPLA